MGKYGGRAKGTPNKLTKLTKEMMQAFLDENKDEAWEAWHKIESPSNKFSLYLKMCEFVLPKMASVELKGDKETPDWVKKLEEIRKGK